MNLVRQSDMYEDGNKGLRMSNFLVRISIVFFCFLLIYLVFLLIGIDFNPLFIKAKSMLLAKGIHFLLSRLGSFGLVLLLAGLLLLDDSGLSCNMMARSGASGDGSGEGTGGRGFRWTDLFGNSSSETGGNSVGSSEASINQPAPHSPEPVAPEVDRGGPFIPEDENGNHLMPAQQRMEELGHRLSINSITKNLSRKEWTSIIAAQIVVEENIEAALVDDGFSPDAILAKRHQIRGFMFYPNGTSLTESTYVGYVRSLENLGTRASVPYKRVIQAIENYDLSIGPP
ncbi:hypothetical protein OROMI_032870 [Orobanche minor]